MITKLLLISSCSFSIFLSSYLNHSLHLAPSLTIAIIGFLGTFYFHQGKVPKADVHALLLMGAFAGTSEALLLKGVSSYFIIASLIYFLFSYSKTIFVGIGGKFGFISFLSCLTLYLLKYLISGTLV